MRKIVFIVTLFLGLGMSARAQQKIAEDPSPVSSKYLRFYPNPANAVIFFEMDPNRRSTVSTLLIFNFMGKKVYEQKNLNTRAVINLEDFYRGIYIFQLRDKNGQILESGKFQVAK